ncbi:hypothetical protein XELAEV_18003556mg [Xenopus laevis]|uniref:Uncharacterized protein n=1 Tax=Xenopus laevis TaxID=8355 RepID=A0A974GZ70_XENLA|nr:hypothetical protein XELAEV_18003556mg [Xenopus laevis]
MESYGCNGAFVGSVFHVKVLLPFPLQCGLYLSIIFLCLCCVKILARFISAALKQEIIYILCVQNMSAEPLSHRQTKGTSAVPSNQPKLNSYPMNIIH